MRILLVNPIVALNPPELGFPLTLIYLGSFLKQFSKEHNVRLLDLTLEWFLRAGKPQDLLEIQKKIIKDVWRNSGPFDIVGITGLCDNFHFTVKLAEFVKKNYSVHVVIGGPHATFISENILKAFSFIDFVVKYEGSSSLLKLCDAISGKGAVCAVPGLAYRGAGGQILHTNTAESVLGLGDIIPSYELLPVAKYLKINSNLAMPVLAGTGCPYSCSYCATSLMWHRRYRMFPAADIAKVVSNLNKKYDIGRYTLIHDNLLFDRDSSLSLCKAMKGLGVSWSCSSRIEHIGDDDELIARLSDSGCKGIFIGLETASKEIQKTIGKNVDAASSIAVLKKLTANKIKPTFSFILGFPEETDSDKNDTLKLAFALKVNGTERVNLNHLSPLPGTKIANEKVKFLRAKRDFRVPGLLDSRFIDFIEKHKPVFGSHWFVTGCKANERFRPSVTKRLHEYCAVHYRSFNYLFSDAGVLPSQLFEQIERSLRYEGLFEKISAITGPKEYGLFREIYKYERSIKRLVSLYPDRRPALLKFSPLELTAHYSLSKRIEILKTKSSLGGFLSLGGKAASKDGNSRIFICLMDAGTTIETYKISRPCFVVFKALQGNTSKKLSEILEMTTKHDAKADVIRALEKLNSMGGLKRVENA